MKCEEVREQFVDMVQPGSGMTSAEAASHLAECAQCTEAFKAFASTLAILDEWRAPEPSPYFDTRFGARLAEAKRDEALRQASQGVMEWLRKPAFGMPVWRPMLVGALALAMAVGVGLFPNQNGQQVGGQLIQAQQGTAVDDLQILDRNHDMFSDFEVLDDLPQAGASGDSQKSSEQL